MNRFVFSRRKAKLLSILILSFLWALILLFIFNSSFTLSTLWLRMHVQINFSAVVVFFQVALFKARGDLNKLYAFNKYLKALLSAFLIAIHVAHALFCGWIAYMLFGQNTLLAAGIGGVQAIFNVMMLSVKQLPSDSVK